MIAAIERIMEYASGLGLAQFQSDRKTVDAVIRNLEILGEAATRVPEEIVFNCADVPWQDIRDMRNLLAHEYFGINEEIVWETINKDLPVLIVQLKQILETSK
jgi:hypothetical protein